MDRFSTEQSGCVKYFLPNQKVRLYIKKQWMQSSSSCSLDVSFSPSREPRRSIIVSHLHTLPAFEVLIARTHVTAQQQHGTVTVRI